MLLFSDLGVKIKDMFWFAGFWRITIPRGTDFKFVSSFIASTRYLQDDISGDDS